jgi:CheY-like chemotaxis protein
MNKRILIADDEPKILQLYKVVFSTSEKEISFFEDFETSDGFNVQMFIDGDLLLDAFKEIYARNERIPLVVLDIYMPGMDGFSVAKEIRKIDSEVMIIFITGVKAVKSNELRRSLEDDIYFHGGKKGKKMLIGLVGFAILFAIAYSLSSGDVTGGVYEKFDITESTSRIIGAMLNTTFLLGGIAILSVIYAGISGFFK